MLSKEYSNSRTDFKKMEVSKLPAKAFKIMTFRKPNEM